MEKILSSEEKQRVNQWRIAVIRHIALNFLKREPSKGSLKRKRYKAALSNEFRSNVLFPNKDYSLALAVISGEI